MTSLANAGTIPAFQKLELCTPRPSSRWIPFRLDETRKLPNCAACYVMRMEGWSGNCYLYVGSTERLNDRFRAHRIVPSYGNDYLTPWGSCRNISFKYKASVRYGDWAMIELRLIRRLKPTLNARGSTWKVKLKSGLSPWPLVTSNFDKSESPVHARIEHVIRPDFQEGMYVPRSEFSSEDSAQ